MAGWSRASAFPASRTVGTERCCLDDAFGSDWRSHTAGAWCNIANPTVVPETSCLRHFWQTLWVASNYQVLFLECIVPCRTSTVFHAMIYWCRISWISYDFAAFLNFQVDKRQAALKPTVEFFLLRHFWTVTFGRLTLAIRPSCHSTGRLDFLPASPWKHLLSCQMV